MPIKQPRKSDLSLSDLYDAIQIGEVTAAMGDEFLLADGTRAVMVNSFHLANVPDDFQGFYHIVKQRNESTGYEFVEEWYLEKDFDFEETSFDHITVLSVVTLPHSD